MKFLPPSRLLYLAILLAGVRLATAQIITVTNGIATYTTLVNTTVNLSNRCEVRVTGTNPPLSGCTINLTTPDTWFVLSNLRPSAAAAYLAQIKINGASAVSGSNVRVDQYGPGTVFVPHAPTFAALTIFSGQNFLGTNTTLGNYTYYTDTGLGAFNRNVSSFKLKRGYACTFAQNADGTGISQNYVAQDGDLEIGALPATLNRNSSFIRVVPWRWTSKKGWAGALQNLVNPYWSYDWDNSTASGADAEYVPMRHDLNWNAYGNINSKQGSTHSLGFNEPDKTDQANMTVATAIANWPNMVKSGLRVGAPAVSDSGTTGTGLSWLYSFIAQADALNYRVDYIPVHWYKCEQSASQFYNYLLGVYQTTGRPVWITEYNNGANWCTTTPPTLAANAAKMQTFVDMFESAPFVERYAVYNWVGTERMMVDAGGALTAAGIVYRDKASGVGYVQAMPPSGATRGVAQLQFNTNALDSSGFGNNGFASGLPNYVAGHSGQAVELDGVNNFIQLPPNVPNGASFTFAAWVYWTGSSQWQRIFDFGDDTTHYMFLSPRSGGNTLRFAISSTGTEQFIETAQLAANTWTHLAVTLTNGAAKLYVNGALAASATGFTNSPATLTPAKNYLGKSQFADPLFAGRLDEVMLTDTALTAAQISSLLTNTPPSFATNQIVRPNAVTAVAYSNSLVGEATDSNAGDTLTYSKASGASWLTVAANGTLTGTPLNSDGGTNIFTVRVTDAAGASAFAQLTIIAPVLFGNGAWTNDSSANWSDTNKWSGNTIASGAGSTADFSTINISGNRTVTLDSSRSIGALKFGDVSGAQTWTLTNSGGSVLTLDPGTNTQPVITVTNTATISCALAGTTGFTKNGAGTLILRGNNSLSGTINVDSSSATALDGVTRISGVAAFANVTLIQIRNTATASSTFQFDGSSGDVTLPANISLNGRTATTAAIENLNGTNAFTGNLTLNSGGNLYTLASDVGVLTCSGTFTAGATATGARTVTFNGNGNHNFSGILAPGSASSLNVIKSGNGSLTFSGTNVFNGTVTNNAGTFYADTTVNSVVLNGGTLGGNGRINTATTIPSSTTLAPGDGLGKLTCGSSLTLGAASTTRFEISKDAATNDLLQVTGAFTVAGSLDVVNAGGSFAVGDSFQLFTAGSISGSFSSVTLAAPGAGLAWNTNALTNGILSVVLGTVAPQFDTPAYDGTNLVSSGSGGAANYPFSVLTATNVAAPFSNWSVLTTGACDVNGGFIFTNPVSAPMQQQYFRLRLP
ncbi:MAG: hypothetical protein RLZZ350_609 [Verrucomicrobiota bacterium]|jgi:autotransporter-associated beta strand protein